MFDYVQRFNALAEIGTRIGLPDRSARSDWLIDWLRLPQSCAFLFLMIQPTRYTCEIVNKWYTDHVRAFSANVEIPSVKYYVTRKLGAVNFNNIFYCSRMSDVKFRTAVYYYLNRIAFIDGYLLDDRWSGSCGRSCGRRWIWTVLLFRYFGPFDGVVNYDFFIRIMVYMVLPWDLVFSMYLAQDWKGSWSQELS